MQYVVKEKTVHAYNSVFYLGFVVLICCLATCVGALLGNRAAQNAVVRREVVLDEKTPKMEARDVKRQPETQSPDVGATTPMMNALWEHGTTPLEWEHGTTPTIEPAPMEQIEVDFSQEGPGGEEIQSLNDDQAELGLYSPKGHDCSTLGEMTHGAEGQQQTQPGRASMHHRGYDLA